MHSTYALQLASLRDANSIAQMSATLIETGLPHSWTPQRVAAHIRHRECTTLTARDASGLLGFALMQFSESSAHLCLLAVAPGVRRRGVGRQMLTWLHESALIAGTFVVNLEVRANNVAARRFYAAMEYAEQGRLSRYYSGVEDSIRMSRNLSVIAPP